VQLEHNISRQNMSKTNENEVETLNANLKSVQKKMTKTSTLNDELARTNSTLNTKLASAESLAADANQEKEKFVDNHAVEKSHLKQTIADSSTKIDELRRKLNSVEDDLDLSNQQNKHLTIQQSSFAAEKDNAIESCSNENSRLKLEISDLHSRIDSMYKGDRNISTDVKEDRKKFVRASSENATLSAKVDSLEQQLMRKMSALKERDVIDIRNDQGKQLATLKRKCSELEEKLVNESTNSSSRFRHGFSPSVVRNSVQRDSRFSATCFTITAMLFVCSTRAMRSFWSGS